MLTWEASAQDRLDTQSGTGGRLPHRSQITWSRQEPKVVIVDGKAYDIGYGNPGGMNDCLIDSLRQCLGLDTNSRKVRDDLMKDFAEALDQRARVTENSFLDLESHWRRLLQSLFMHNASGIPRDCDLESYCVISLYTHNGTDSANGLVVGNIMARNRLVVMNTSDVHFDPCLPRD